VDGFKTFRTRLTVGGWGWASEIDHSIFLLLETNLYLNTEMVERERERLEKKNIDMVDVIMNTRSRGWCCSCLMKFEACIWVCLVVVALE